MSVPARTEPNGDAGARRAIDQMLVASTCDLFLAYGQLIQRHTLVSPKAMRLPEDTAIGSTAEVRGAMVDGRVPSGRLILTTSFDLVAASHPARAGGKPLSAAAPGDWLYVRDWAKELANQLLGRLTNRIGAYNITLSPGRCTALTGPVVAAEIAAQKTPLLAFQWSRHQLYVGLDLVLPPKSEAQLSGTAQRYVATEGTVLFLDSGPSK